MFELGAVFLATMSAVFFGVFLATQRAAAIWRESHRVFQKESHQEFQNKQIQEATLLSDKKNAAEQKFYELDKRLEKIRDEGPHFGKRGTPATSKTFNIKWARQYCLADNVFRQLVYGHSLNSDEYFEKIVGDIHDHLRYVHDLYLGNARRDFDEEMLEFAIFEKDPASIASFRRALRRHQELLPIVQKRYDWSLWNLKYSVIWWDMFLRTRDRLPPELEALRCETGEVMPFERSESEIKALRENADLFARKKLGERPELLPNAGTGDETYNQYYFLEWNGNIV